MSSDDKAVEGPLEVRLFGAFDVRVGGRSLPPLRYRKEQWLLALLALRHDRDVSRDWLAATFWPDNDEKQALFYLRKALSNLRNALGEESGRLLSPSTRTVRLDLQGAFADFVMFDAAVVRPVAAEDREARLCEALDLYRGPLLQDCLEEWAIVERETRVQAYLKALEENAERALARGEAAAASRWLRLALVVEPHRESAACAMMRALAESGDRAALRQVYHDLRLRLRGELNSSPAPETDALYKRLSQQEAVPDLPARATPVKPSLRHLPVPLTDLIGRNAEIAELSGWLERRRLVTLLGPGGVGKTRLSIAVAEAIMPRFPDGAWFVDLAPVTDGSYVESATAYALGLQLEATASITDQLIEELRARSLLLVLDNCEHLPDACASLASRLLGACSDLRILATSRQALVLAGEQVYPVPSLALPPQGDLHGRSGLLAIEKDPSCLMDYAGIRLFVQRAVLANPSFRLDRRNGLAVAEVCQHLDGIPLAIELAAARVRSLSVEEINGRLDQRFRLLTGGSRAALPRQQTLRALIDWSFDLLTDAEKTLLCWASVFAGGWTLAAAESVCAGGASPGGQPIEACEVLDLLTSLVDKSLASAEQGTDEAGMSPVTRYWLLETVKQYGQERLRAVGQANAAQARHRDYFLGLAEQAAPELMGRAQARWFNRLEADHDNLRVALDYCAEGASTAASSEAALSGLRLSMALTYFWWTRGYLNEGRVQLSRALASRNVAEAWAADKAAAAKLVARTLHSAGILAGRQSDYAAAQSLYEESLLLSRPLGDTHGAALSIHNLGLIASYQGNYAVAHARYEECLALLRGLDEKLSLARALGNLGRVFCYQGDYPAARAILEQSLEGYRETGHTLGVALVLGDLGAIAARQGENEAGRVLFEESLELSQEVGDKNIVAGTMIGIGFAAVQQGDYTSAQSIYADSLRLTRQTVDRRVAACGLEGMAACAAGLGDAHRAAVFFAAAASLRQSIGAPIPPNERGEIEAGITKMRALIGESGFAAAWAEGMALSREQVVALALGE